MVDPRWLECDTCQNCRRTAAERYCGALGRVLDRPLVVECELYLEREDLPQAVQLLLAKRYSGLY
jgi:hypothetical protein